MKGGDLAFSNCNSGYLSFFPIFSWVSSPFANKKVNYFSVSSLFQFLHELHMLWNASKATQRWSLSAVTKSQCYAHPWATVLCCSNGLHFYFASLTTCFSSSIDFFCPELLFVICYSLSSASVYKSCSQQHIIQIPPPKKMYAFCNIGYYWIFHFCSIFFQFCPISF